MRAQVVHHHYIAGLQYRIEQMFHVGQENVGVGGSSIVIVATMSLRLMAPRIVMIFQWPRTEQLDLWLHDYNFHRPHFSLN